MSATGNNIGNCRECGATVRWSITASGSRIPLNPQPIKVAMGLSAAEGGTVVVREAFAIHFSTCTKKLPTPRRGR
jgi:hypothetical protein